MLWPKARIVGGGLRLVRVTVWVHDRFRSVASSVRTQDLRFLLVVCFSGKHIPVRAVLTRFARCSIWCELAGPDPRYGVWSSATSFICYLR